MPVAPSDATRAAYEAAPHQWPSTAPYRTLEQLARALAAAKQARQTCVPGSLRHVQHTHRAQLLATKAMLLQAGDAAPPIVRATAGTRRALARAHGTPHGETLLLMEMHAWWMAALPPGAMEAWKVIV